MMPPLRRQRSAGPPSTHGTASPCDPQARDTSPTRISVRLAVKKKTRVSPISIEHCPGLTLEHHDPLRPRDRRQPVRHNHTRRLPLRQYLVDRIVDTVLTRRIQRARCLVQRKDRGALQ